ncbi:MAG: hypothetical protein AAF196_17400 [Planctomycetota bacterium]
MSRSRWTWFCAPTLTLALSGCTTVETAGYTRHLESIDGEPQHYVRLRHYGVDLFGVFPMSPNTPDVLIRDLTGIVKQHGGTTFDLVVERQSTYWSALPPLSWFFSPTVSEVGAVFVPHSEDDANDDDRSDSDAAER